MLVKGHELADELTPVVGGHPHAIVHILQDLRALGHSLRHGSKLVLAGSRQATSSPCFVARFPQGDVMGAGRTCTAPIQPLDER